MGSSRRNTENEIGQDKFYTCTFNPVEEVESRIRKVPFLLSAGNALTLSRRNSSKYCQNCDKWRKFMLK